MSNLFGNTAGLKADQLRRLKNIYRRRIPPSEVITGELARYITSLSFEIRKQIGMIIDRQGQIRCVIIGDQKEIVIPDISEFALGRRNIRGVRCVHTHLKDEALSQDDLTDLALLRLDLMAAVGVGGDGLPAHIYMANLIPPNPAGKTYRVHEKTQFQQLDLNLSDFLSILDEELSVGAEVKEVEKGDRAVIVSVSLKSKSEQEDSLEELKELARTAGVTVIGSVIQRPKLIHPKYLMGEGKIKELLIKSLQGGANLIILDQNLSPTQVKSIADITDIRVIDRTQLILDIFARRAHSRDGKVQVELAQLKYLLPRLIGTGKAMSRLMGGVGGRGPGEMKLEVDRRRIRDRITHLERELEHLSRARQQRKEKRVQSHLPIISIVGYTNAGKSTLLNSLTKSNVKTEDLLFATLDTSSRRLRFPKEREVIITDTVGFIRELPEDLLGAFRATLDELRDARLLLHVVDISNPRFDQQMESVDQILRELGLDNIPRLVVFNKQDKAEPDEVKMICQRFNAIAISAINPETLLLLLAVMEEMIWREPGAHKGK
ncbi:MAG: GTPase HflX [Nitrospirae bacterium]|nr:GTPase HflX [Nitrospirota bacterium]